MYSLYSLRKSLALAVPLICFTQTWSGQNALALGFSPPLGIPAPSFGITQVAPASPAPWTTATPGFYYVDEGATGATDSSNPYGTPGRPRRTIPSSLPAGSVVELHGRYTFTHTSPNDLKPAGTAAQPVFVRGSSSSTRPTITRSWEVKGSYVIFENLSFAFEDAGHGNFTFLAPTHHAALRASEVRGNVNGGGINVASWDSSTVNNVVISGNVIHDNGDVNATFDQDVHGVMVGDDVSYLWIVDNELYRNSGDGIQINGSRTGLHHVYVGRNVSHHNKQSGMWTKTASDVIFSENKVYGHRPSDSSSGQGMGFQYDPQRVWFLFNESYDNALGANSGSGDNGGRSNVYFVGNVFRNNLDAGLQLNDWVDGEYVVGNTFYYNPIGLANGYYQVGLEISNNIFSASGAAHISFREYGSGSSSNIRNSLFDSSARIIWDDATYDVAGLQRTGECGGCRSGSPQFVNAAAGDFNLQSGSPAIDGGVLESVYATFQSLYGIDIRKDKAGRTRPVGAAWDIGAFEAADRAH